MHVRPITARDLPGCYHVCVETSNADGGNRDWSNRELLGHVYVGPYFFGPTATGFVITDENGIAGYCLGVADTPAFEEWAHESWWPALQQDYPYDAAYLGEEAEVVSILHRPFRTEEHISAWYPAHLHIDLLERAQGKGWGRRLMDLLLTDLARLGASGVHLGVGPENTRAIQFYEHLGFSRIGEGDDVLFMAKGLSDR